MGKIIVIKNVDYSTNAVAKVNIFRDKIVISVVSSPSSGGTITGGGMYEKGDNVTLVAIPAFGYEFKQWDDGVTTASRNIVVGSVSKSFTAIFEQLTPSLERLYFDGNTYIDLGMPLNGRYDVEIDFSTEYDAVGAWIFGAIRNNLGFAFLKRAEIGLYRWHSSRFKNEINDKLNFSERSKILFKNDGKLYKDSQVIYDAGGATPSFITQDNALLGALNENGSPNIAKFKGNLYGFKIISENGNVLLDLVPNAVNGVYCFYDRISEQNLMPTEGNLTPIQPPSYGKVTFNGTEDWQFNSNGEPNSHGIYNCYLLNPNVVNPLAGPTDIETYGFGEATCNITSLNRNIPSSELRGASQSMGFGYNSTDPSVFFRFDNTIATSVETFKAYLAENNITIVYKQNT